MYIQRLAEIRHAQYPVIQLINTGKNDYPHDYLNTLTAKAFPSFPNPRLKSRGNMLPHSSVLVAQLNTGLSPTSLRLLTPAKIRDETPLHRKRWRGKMRRFRCLFPRYSKHGEVTARSAGRERPVLGEC